MKPRPWIFFGMVTLIAASFMASKFMPGKGSLLALCLWDVVFLSSGLFAIIRPVGWLNFTGNKIIKPPSVITQRMIRCFGVFAFLAGAMGAINLIVNIRAYWNGLY